MLAFVGCGIVTAALPTFAKAQVVLEIDALQSPGFSMRSLKATLAGARQPELRLEIGEITIDRHSWRDARVFCSALELTATTIGCPDGSIEIGEKFPLSFTFETRTKSLDFTIRPGPGEAWRLRAKFSEADPDIEVSIERGRLLRLASFLPAGLPRIGNGTVSGTVRWSGAGTLAVNGDVEAFAFSDEAGLRAGEKISGRVNLAARRLGARWHWQGNLEWLTGEVYWQPLYLRGFGHALAAEGVLDAAQVEVSGGRLRDPMIGEAEFEGTWDRRTGAIARGSARTGRLDGAALYAQVLKPFFSGTAIANLRVGGALRMQAQIEGGELAAAQLDIEKFSFDDAASRFGLFGVDGRIPWQRSETTRASLAFAGGEVMKLPFGSAQLFLEVGGSRVALDRVEVPLLDGVLTVNDFVADSGKDGWRWRFNGGITPISMTRFAQSVGLPTMHGSVSAVIPEVSYDKSTLAVGGALLFRVFGGTVVARNLRLVEPFGRAPRLTADLDAQGLDLELVTRTYSFGNITGRIDASVRELELANWQPVRFDARVASSPGDYPRKISQTAVENITALGGAGASGAIQRSFLRFFDQFGYEKLGLSCRLRNGVCEMDGVEDAQHGYTIVKGGGIPAISVIGYNRRVDWPELIGRVRRITQDNVRAIIQ